MITKAETRKTIAALKERIAEMRAHCAACDRWECGCCGETKYNLENELERLLMDAAPHGSRTLAWLRKPRHEWARKEGASEHDGEP